MPALFEIFYKIKNCLMGTSRRESCARQQSLAIADLVFRWVHTYLPSIGSQSVHTIRSYKVSLGMFCSFLSEKKSVTRYNITLDCFSPKTLNEWMLWMRAEKSASPSTCNNRMAAIKSLLRYMGSESMDLSYLYNQTHEHVKALKTVQKEVESVSTEALKALFAEPDLETSIGRRDYAFMLLSYGTGARLNEILSIKIRDIVLKKGKGLIHIIGKGNKLRTIPLLDDLVDCIASYVKEFHGTSPQDGDLLFFSRCHGTRAMLTQAAISKRLKYYASAAHKKCSDMPADFHAHIFRHARATHWREEGMNLVEIKELLGHSSLASTMIYQTVSYEQKRKAMEKLGDDEINNLPKKWTLPENASLAAAFGIG